MTLFYLASKNELYRQVLDKYFNDEIRGRYETLHEDLLYTSDRQSFEKAIQAFEFISQLFASIGE